MFFDLLYRPNSAYVFTLFAKRTPSPLTVSQHVSRYHRYAVLPAHSHAARSYTRLGVFVNPPLVHIQIQNYTEIGKKAHELPPQSQSDHALRALEAMAYSQPKKGVALHPWF